MLRACYDQKMETISQRELRNNSAEVMRGLAQGKTYRLTNRGTPVGMLTPSGSTALDELVLREGSQDMEFDRGVTTDERSDDVLAELRERS